MTRRLILTSLAALCLSAQDIPNPVVPGDHFDISGNVVDSVTAKPIARAQVQLQPQAPAGSVRTALTDQSGNFAMPRVPLGIYTLESSKNGYTTGEDAYHKVILVSGTQPDHFTLKLEPQAVLSGTVTDDAGGAVAGAGVALLRPEIDEGYMRMHAVQTKETDDRGAFRFPGLGAGRYYVCVLTQPTPYDAQNGIGYPPTFFPNATDASGAQSIDVRPGDERQVTISAQYTDAFHVKGKVTPIGMEARIDLRPEDRTLAEVSLPLEAKIDRRGGTFDIASVPNGTYILSAVGEGARPLRAERRIVVSDKDTLDADLNLAPPTERSIEGAVHLEGDTPVKSVASEVGLIAPGAGSAGAVDGAGKFLIPATPGSYRLTATLGANWYVLSATQGGRDVMHGKVLVGEDGTGDPLSVTVSPNGAIIEATVTWPDAGPRPPALITVLEAHGAEMLVVAEAKVAPPNEPATVRPMLIGHLAPGQYVVYAWPEPVQVEYAKPDALRPFEGFAQTVTLDEGAQMPVGVKLALNP